MKILIVLFALVCATMAQYFWTPPPVYTRTALGNSIDLSSMKLLKASYETNEDKNIVSSPLGLMTLLSLFNEGAGPNSQVEISRFLGGTNAKQIADSFERLSVMFSEMNPDVLSVANKISVSDQFSLDENFAARARGYRSEFDKLDFTKPAEAAAIINRWAAEKTKGHITEPVRKDMLRPDTAAALFNIIFFNGHWHVPFDAAHTKDKDFYVTKENVVKKPMMHLMQSLYYTESEQLGARMIELPYKESGFRMVVVLPNEIDGLPSVLEKASEKGLLEDIFKLSPAGRDVELDMPKFDIRTKLDFNEILPKVGVSEMYEEAATGIVKGVPVKVSKAFQEAFIKVNEEGATAGAFTGVLFVTYSENSTTPPPVKFTVDRPFLYAILYEDKIIFVGTYSS